MLKIKTLTFVVHLFGVIDLLRPLKNLSLDLQAVNVLPWEIDELITIFLSDIELLERDYQVLQKATSTKKVRSLYTLHQSLCK